MCVCLLTPWAYNIMLYTPFKYSLPQVKNTKFVVTTWFFQAQNASKPVSLGPSNPIVGWGGGHPLSIPLYAFGVSISPPFSKRDLRQ